MISNKEYLLIGISAWVSSLSSFFMIRTIPNNANLFQAMPFSGIVILTVSICIMIMLRILKID